MVGEISRQKRRLRTLHSPDQKTKRTCYRVPEATPDATGLLPLPPLVRSAKERGQNSIRSTCCARSKFQKNTTGRRDNFCSQQRPIRGRIQTKNTTINHMIISIYVFGAHLCVSGWIGLLWLSWYRISSAAFFDHFVSVFYMVDCCNRVSSCCTFAMELKLSHAKRMVIGRPPACPHPVSTPCGSGGDGPPWWRGPGITLPSRKWV